MKYSKQFNKPIKHNTHSSHHINHYLANVFSSLFAGLSCVIVGLIAHIAEIFQLGLATVFIFFGLLLGLYFVEHNTKNSLLRYRLLLGLGFCSGQLLGPLFNIIIGLNPQFIMILVGTCIILVLFSSISVLARNGQIMLLVGIIAADFFLVISINTLASDGTLGNPTRNLFFIEIAFLSYIIFDYRSKIIRIAKTGNNDYIHHAFDIFFELLNAFRNAFRTEQNVY